MNLFLFSLLVFIPSVLAGVVDLGARGLSEAADTVANGQLEATGGLCDGADCFLEIAYFVWHWLKRVFTVIATFMIVRYGFTLINSQEEEKLRKAKQMIGASIAAIMLLYLPEKLVPAFYGGYTAGGFLDPDTAGKAITTPAASAGIVTSELAGIILWLETIVAVLAVTIIIVSGILAVTSYGKEEGGTQFKHTVGAVIFGVFLIVIKKVILDTFGLVAEVGPENPTPTIVPALQKIIQVVSSLLGFAGLLCAAVIIYAGILMALNFGNEEQYNNAKGIILRAAIGLLAIIASLAVIQLVMEIGNPPA